MAFGLRLWARCRAMLVGLGARCAIKPSIRTKYYANAATNLVGLVQALLPPLFGSS
jgi:hypothetical protein